MVMDEGPEVDRSMAHERRRPSEPPLTRYRTESKVMLAGRGSSGFMPLGIERIVRCGAPAAELLATPSKAKGTGTADATGAGVGGAAVGATVGTGVGSGVGAEVGCGVGTGVGIGVGAAVGARVGAGVGAPVGTDVGACVGAAVVLLAPVLFVLLLLS